MIRLNKPHMKLYDNNDYDAFIKNHVPTMGAVQNISRDKSYRQDQNVWIGGDGE